MATGQALFVAGDIMWNWYETIGESPFPSLADVLYLAGYPFIAFGLLLLIKRRIGDGDRGGLLDAAILTTAVAILSWTFFIRPLTIDTELDPLSLAISLAYPVADLLLIGVAMGLLTTPGARTPAFRMLGLSLVALLVADQIYAFQNLDESYVAGGALDSVYLIAYILFGTAVAHPSMRRLTDPAPVAVTWLGPVRMICLAAAMVTGPLLVTIGPDADGGLAVIAAGTALLSLLVLARLYGLVGILARDVAKRRALESQLSYQAFHDPLTGLANRRRFVDQAEAALGGRSRVGSIAALFVDLDDFKTVNDSLGHAAGDELLVAVAARIRDGLRSTDVAARLGGDEFGVLLLDIPDPAYATTVAERLLAGISAPLDGRGRPGRGQRQHRRRRRHRGDARRGRPAERRRRRDVPGQGPRQGPPARLRRQPRGPRRRRAPLVRRPADRPAAGLRPRAPGAGGRLGPGHRTRLDGAATTSERRADAGPGLMKIPLFPLHTVLCPGIVVPLHIFEERYREMTRRCLDTGEPFGVVLIREGREVGSRSISTLAGVGAFAEIRRAGRYPDGRYDLLAAGTGRFMIESVDAGSAAYLVADVTPLDDEVGDEPRAERLAATAIGRFVRYLELMRARDGETADVLDIQVEVEAAGSSEDDEDARRRGHGRGDRRVDDRGRRGARSRCDDRRTTTTTTRSRPRTS